jgi:hypothetical protein
MAANEHPECPHCHDSDPRHVLVLRFTDLPQLQRTGPIIICRLCAFAISTVTQHLTVLDLEDV